MACATRKADPPPTDRPPSGIEQTPGERIVVAPPQRLLRVRLLESPGSLDVATSATTDVLTAAFEPLARQLPPIRGPVRREASAWVLDGRRIEHDADILLVPRTNAAVRIAGAVYRGAVLLQHDRATGQFAATNLVDVEQYLLGLDEMPASFHAQAHRAQMIAARTYALDARSQRTGRPWDLLATEASQVYRGVAAEQAVRVQAVRSTAGMVLTAPDASGRPRLFTAFFSSTCGGTTTDMASVRAARSSPALRGAVACPCCTISPHCRWGPVDVPLSEVTRRLARYPAIAALGPLNAVQIEQTDPAGRITMVRVASPRGSDTLRGEDFRLCLGSRLMKSTVCRLEVRGSTLRITDGRGFGHGMGLCQYGAEALARQGRNAEHIVLHYYPGASLRQAYPDVPDATPLPGVSTPGAQR